jgi:hypothetical protein
MPSSPVAFQKLIGSDSHHLLLQNHHDYQNNGDDRENEVELVGHQESSVDLSAVDVDKLVSSINLSSHFIHRRERDRFATVRVLELDPKDSTSHYRETSLRNILNEILEEINIRPGRRASERFPPLKSILKMFVFS